MRSGSFVSELFLAVFLEVEIDIFVLGIVFYLKLIGISA